MEARENSTSTAHLLKLTFSCASLAEDTAALGNVERASSSSSAGFERAPSSSSTSFDCSVSFAPRHADGIGSQLYKRLAWLHDAAFLGCFYEHASFIGRKGTPLMQHGTSAAVAERFFNVGGGCRGYPCVPSWTSEAQSRSWTACDLKSAFKGPNKNRLAAQDGEAWFLRTVRRGAMRGAHCSGEVPPLRHSTAFFSYSK